MIEAEVSRSLVTYKIGIHGNGRGGRRYRRGLMRVSTIQRMIDVTISNAAAAAAAVASVTLYVESSERRRQSTMDVLMPSAPLCH